MNKTAAARLATENGHRMTRFSSIAPGYHKAMCLNCSATLKALDGTVTGAALDFVCDRAPVGLYGSER